MEINLLNLKLILFLILPTLTMIRTYSSPNFKWKVRYSGYENKQTDHQLELVLQLPRKEYKKGILTSDEKLYVDTRSSVVDFFGCDFQY